MSDHDRLSIMDADETRQGGAARRAGDSGKKRRRPLLIALIALLALVLGLGALAAFYLNRVDSAISSIVREDLLPTRQSAGTGTGSGGSGEPQAQILPEPKGTNYVLMGSDSRGGADIGRSDTLMIAHLTADKSKLYLISFPRDMWVDVPGRGKAKINAAYAWGGPQLTVQTLEQLLRVKMDHAAMIDFEGFIQLTDVLGGVDVFNPNTFSIDGYYFPAGMTHLQGAEALAYVRERKSLPNGDLDRAANQRAVISAIVDEAVRPEVLANPATFSKLMDQGSKAIRVDSSLTDEEVRKTAGSLRMRSGSDVISMQAPISGFATSADGQAIDVVDEARMAELAKALQTDTLDKYLAQYPT